MCTMTARGRGVGGGTASQGSFVFTAFGFIHLGCFESSGLSFWFCYCWLLSVLDLILEKLTNKKKKKKTLAIQFPTQKSKFHVLNLYSEILGWPFPPTSVLHRLCLLCNILVFIFIVPTMQCALWRHNNPPKPRAWVRERERDGIRERVHETCSISVNVCSVCGLNVCVSGVCKDKALCGKCSDHIAPSRLPPTSLKWGKKGNGSKSSLVWSLSLLLPPPHTLFFCLSRSLQFDLSLHQVC